MKKILLYFLIFNIPLLGFSQIMRDIGGVVFMDVNSNGTKDVSENGYIGSKLYLHEDLNEDGVIDPTDNLIDSVNSGAQGTFLFQDSGYDYHTQNTQVSHLYHDATEIIATGIMNRDSAFLVYGINQLGFYFPNIELRPGATITSAYLQFTASGLSAGANGNISVEATDNANIPSDTGFDLSSRVYDTNIVAFSTGLWLDDQVYNSPDISHLIQNTIDRPGWDSLNSLLVKLQATIGETIFHAYDSANNKGVKLIIESVTSDTSYYIVSIDLSSAPPGTVITTPSQYSFSLVNSESMSSSDFGFKATLLSINQPRLYAISNTKEIIFNITDLNLKENSAFEIEMSKDEKTYTCITCNIELASRNQYKSNIDKFGSGNIYFRLKYVDRNGHITHTSPINIWLPHSTPFNFYPNPATNNIRIKNFQEVQKVEIYCIRGRLVLSQTDLSQAINLDQIPSGTYLTKTYRSNDILIERLIVR